ncbi:MAG: FKBP-type peptidyl-prolyl cis-trans isomerase [Fibrobacteres bacterium]|nr:FKBP-type peptidyl-prolyl cis-trans isomerase [Fibrobacterota bacterium]
MGLAVLAFSFLACDKIDTKGSRELKTQKDKVSYGIGLDIGRSFKQQNLAVGDVDLDKLRFGINDALTGAKPAMSDSQLTETMMAFQKDMMARLDSTNKVKAAENEKAAKAFLEKNGKEPGVITTPSGLQYKVLTEGKGPKPDSSSTVTVHYVGTLLDGTEFDSSIKRGQPVSFPVGNVIKGWTEALQLMPVGSKYKLWIPPAIGYGERGAGKQIGPNSLLIFEVELISLGDATKPAGAPAPDAPKAGKPALKPAH